MNPYRSRIPNAERPDHAGHPNLDGRERGPRGDADRHGNPDAALARCNTTGRRVSDGLYVARCDHGGTFGADLADAYAKLDALHAQRTYAAHHCAVTGCTGRLVYVGPVNGTERWTCDSGRCLEVYRPDADGVLCSTWGEPAVTVTMCEGCDRALATCTDPATRTCAEWQARRVAS